MSFQKSFHFITFYLKASDKSSSLSLKYINHFQNILIMKKILKNNKILLIKIWATVWKWFNMICYQIVNW